MTATVRKGVLLRLDPDLLARVDAERALQSRTSWLTGAVEKYLDQLSSSDAKNSEVDLDGTPPVHEVDQGKSVVVDGQATRAHPPAFPPGGTADRPGDGHPGAHAAEDEGIVVGDPSANFSQLPRPEPGSPCLLGGASGDTVGRALGATPAVAREGASDSEAPSPPSWMAELGY